MRIRIELRNDDDQVIASTAFEPRFTEDIDEQFSMAKSQLLYFVLAYYARYAPEVKPL